MLLLNGLLQKVVAKCVIQSVFFPTQDEVFVKIGFCP